MMHFSPHKRPHGMMVIQPSMSGQNWPIFSEYGHCAQPQKYIMPSSRLQRSNHSDFSKKTIKTNSYTFKKGKNRKDTSNHRRGKKYTSYIGKKKKKGKRSDQKMKTNQGYGHVSKAMDSMVDKTKEKALPLISQAPFPENMAERLPKTIRSLPPEKTSVKLKKKIINPESHEIRGMGIPIQPPIVPIHSSMLQGNLQLGNKNDIKRAHTITSKHSKLNGINHHEKENKVPIQPPPVNANDLKVIRTEDLKHSSKKKKSKKGPNRRNQKGFKKNKHRRRLKIQRRTIAQNYKTELCQSHLTLGYCEYEELCQFAHGVDELLPRQFGLKYKTEKCKNYHTDGHCRFGSRCKFLHDEVRKKKSGK